jgi:sarcosine oxidase
VTAAQALGAEIHAREPVLGWETMPGGGVRVTTSRDTYEAGRLVLSAGAWGGSLAPALAPLAIPERQVLGWFQPRDPALFGPDAFPVANLAFDEGRYYLLPAWSVPGLKIGLYHHAHEQVDPDALDRSISTDDEALLRLCLQRYFPEANGPAMALAPCMFTNTPDEHFIIDALPDAPEVLALSACSGHGFKFVPVVGEIVADLVTTGQSRFDLSMFRLARF